jgi:hypothetical protein
MRRIRSVVTGALIPGMSVLVVGLAPGLAGGATPALTPTVSCPEAWKESDISLPLLNTTGANGPGLLTQVLVARLWLGDSTAVTPQNPGNGGCVVLTVSQLAGGNPATDPGAGVTISPVTSIFFFQGNKGTVIPLP